MTDLSGWPELSHVLGGGAGVCGLAADGRDKLVDEAASDGLAGLLYCLVVGEQLSVPTELRNFLRQQHTHTAVDNVAILAELGALLESWGNHGLQVLLMPGASLLGAYPDIGCRAMDDVDIAVRGEDRQDVCDVLDNLGFAAVPGHDDLYAGRSLVLDLHEDLLNSNRISARREAGHLPLESVFADSRTIRAGGSEVQTLNAEDTVLYTAVHALKHSFRRKAWFVDLLLSLPEVDWGRLREKAQRYRLARPLLYCLCHIRDALGIELPEPARTWVAGSSVNRVEHYLLQRLGCDTGSLWGEVLWSYNCPGITGQARFLFEYLFPRPRVLRQVFPGVPGYLTPFTYGLRLGQICLRGASELVRLAKVS